MRRLPPGTSFDVIREVGHLRYQIAERRSRPVAAVALARKLAGILFAIWRDGTTYEPQRAARRSAPM